MYIGESRVKKSRGGLNMSVSEWECTENEWE